VSTIKNDSSKTSKSMRKKSSAGKNNNSVMIENLSMADDSMELSPNSALIGSIYPSEHIDFLQGSMEQKINP
jgi:hypothetical protein